MRTKRIKATIQPPRFARDEDSAALELVSAWLERDQAWEQWAASQAYDGILGALPDWMGPEIQEEFLRVRKNLLGSNYAGIHVTPALALSWLDHFCQFGEEGVPEASSDLCFEHHFHQVEQLAHWRWLHSQGQAKAQVQVGGPDLIESAAVGKKHKTKQREIARRPRTTAFDDVFGQLLGPEYEEWKNKDLWNLLISLSDNREVIIEEIEIPLSLRWEDDRTGRRARCCIRPLPPSCPGCAQSAAS